SCRERRAVFLTFLSPRFQQLLDDYPKCFIVEADNVGSKQMQTIRLSLRGKAVVLMGKNTMMRKAIRGHLENNPSLERLLPHIRGNVGFVFTKEDLTEVRDLLLANKVPAAARAGAIAPCEVTVPAQNTGLGPEKTSFFQFCIFTIFYFRMYICCLRLHFNILIKKKPIVLLFIKWRFVY
uniref:Large ribosomal subunit protein uL10 n=1 Tax=Sinocyclocheilus grahami TaxID=75366 RepID=A0A672SRA0_SINGR